MARIFALPRALIIYVAMIGAAEARKQLSVRDDDNNPNKTTKAGITLAIILGTVLGGLSLLFAVMGILLYMRYKRNKRRNAEAGLPGPGQERRKSADTMIDYSTNINSNELQDLSGRRP